jgi:hypothetical protein
MGRTTVEIRSKKAIIAKVEITKQKIVPGQKNKIQ